MKEINVGELKADFSAVLDEVARGEDIHVLYGRAKKTVAVITSPEKAANGSGSRRIGLYDGIATFGETGDGKITPEEFFGL